MSVPIYEIIVFVHVLAALILIGSAFWSARLRTAVRAAATRAELAAFIGFAIRSTRINPLAALVLLGSGIYLGSYGWWSAAWFYVAAGAWVANLLLAVLVVGPAERAVLEAARRDGGEAIDGGLDRARGRRSWDLAAAAMLANDLAMVWVMFNKPGLAGAILAVALFNAAFVAFALLRAPRPSRTAFA
ncbi:MAG TPA: hypothetical protein VFV54_11025 [Thermoanaerobaculia bacterium]|nr:hypothetical protein [Thermoanaerobaculia bacterium]